MNQQIIFLSIILFAFLQACSTSERATIPPKANKSTDYPVNYFQPTSSQATEKSHVVEIEAENKKAPIAEKQKTTKNTAKNPTIPAYTPATNAKKYQIVSGSFRNEKNADRLIKTLKKLGFAPSFKQKSTEGFYRVIIKQTQTESEAREFLQSYRKNYPAYSDAWLLY